MDSVPYIYLIHDRTLLCHITRDDEFLSRKKILENSSLFLGINGVNWTGGKREPLGLFIFKHGNSSIAVFTSQNRWISLLIFVQFLCAFFSKIVINIPFFFYYFWSSSSLVICISPRIFHESWCSLAVIIMTFSNDVPSNVGHWWFGQQSTTSICAMKNYHRVEVNGNRWPECVLRG